VLDGESKLERLQGQVDRLRAQAEAVLRAL
jgi:hypothetical protein